MQHVSESKQRPNQHTLSGTAACVKEEALKQALEVSHRKRSQQASYTPH